MKLFVLYIVNIISEIAVQSLKVELDSRDVQNHDYYLKVPIQERYYDDHIHHQDLYQILPNLMDTHDLVSLDEEYFM